jgi:hypothetical protein
MKDEDFSSETNSQRHEQKGKNRQNSEKPNPRLKGGMKHPNKQHGSDISREPEQEIGAEIPQEKVETPDIRLKDHRWLLHASEDTRLSTGSFNFPLLTRRSCSKNKKNPFRKSNFKNKKAPGLYPPGAWVFVKPIKSQFAPGALLESPPASGEEFP